MRLEEKNRIFTILGFIKVYTEINDTEMALQHIEGLMEDLENVGKETPELKAVDSLTKQVKYQSELRNGCLKCGQIMDAAYHDMLAKALCYAKMVIVNDSNDEFEYKGDTKNENND